ncbi:lipid-A-disaccharide synthase [Neptunomonas marina]|nr:lipid-A-disaccharide synthase [Neptunomonas marina]
MPSLRIAMVAGEASGDILGADLITHLKQRYPDAEFFGIGGDLMISKGFRSIVPIERLSVMGLVEVLGRLWELLRLRRDLANDLIANPPDLFIGIDAPDFNLGLAERLKASGITTVHYVSPSVWAWKRKRIFKIKRAVDLLLTLFPFEPKYYRETQQRVEFVGHPLADQIAIAALTKADCRDALELPHNATVVALMPGSRGSEVKYLAAPFLAAAKQLQAQLSSDIQFVIPAANQKRFDELSQLLSHHPELPARLVMKQSREVLKAADAVLIASGTATLEAMLLGCPTVVAYRMSPITFRIFSRLVKTPYVALPNILAGEALVPEILQDDVEPERLAEALVRALQDRDYRQHVEARFVQLSAELRCNAGEQAANAIEKLLHDMRPKEG